jgi:trans-aconitate 2-methyltransferase
MAAAADGLEEKIMSELASPYAFGDTPVARERLELLGVVFDPPSRAFLARSVPLPPALAADLGCGPGATTRMVHEATGAHRTMGLDRSPEFVAAARERPVDGIDYHLWQAQDPLPGDAPDLIYARLLLAHLPRPTDLVARWASQLSPAGQLLVDEVECIETGNEAFREYLAMATALVRAGGSEMFAGPLLARLRLRGQCELGDDRVVSLPVPPAVAARMFYLNLTVWGGAPWVTANYGPKTVARVGEDLLRISAGSAAADITWKMRQIVVRAAPTP